MENLKTLILEVLNKNTETANYSGSCGELGGSFKAINSEDFSIVVDEISNIINSCTDPENQPNQYGVVLFESEKKSFEQSVEVVMKYISENHHPHTMIQIDSTSSTLWEGQKRHLTEEFLKD